jgi:hypothetical protein
MPQFERGKLQDFFFHYDPDNSNHREAVLQLESELGNTLLSDGSPWVQTYRTPLPEVIPPAGKVSVPAPESHRKEYTGHVNWSEPRSMVSRYFSVGEVTQMDRRRIPTAGSAVVKNILKLALELDKLRDAWGHPIGITSWYRPPAINAAVGGVSNSQHINGGAVDVYTIGGDPKRFEEWLKTKWGGGLGYGVASGRGFTHLDLRGGGFEHGAGTIRWWY